MSANEKQVGGTHYTDMPVQPWDAMQAWMTPEQFCGYLLGNVIKYAARHPAKGGVEDLKKARHYLDKLIEFREQGRAEAAAVLREAIDTMDQLLKPKEVIQPEGHSDPQPPATTPAVSESAAGEWPGPDWSQAPEWAVAWAMDKDAHSSTKSRYHWYFKVPRILNAAWNLGCYDVPLNLAFCAAADFGYTGDWRDSLRKRPEEVK